MDQLMVFRIVSAALTALLVAAAWTDYRSRRIPNTLTVTGLATALLLRALLGPEAIIEGLVGALLAFVLTLPLLVLGVMGGGDAKLLSIADSHRIGGVLNRADDRERR